MMAGFFKIRRNPGMYEFTEPADGTSRGQKEWIENYQKISPYLKDGRDPKICTAVQRVNWLNGALKEAHDQVDEVQAELDRRVAEMELDRQELRKQIDKYREEWLSRVEQDLSKTRQINELARRLICTRQEHAVTLQRIRERNSRATDARITVQNMATSRLIADHDWAVAVLRAEVEKASTISSERQEELEQVMHEYYRVLGEHDRLHQENIRLKEELATTKEELTKADKKITEIKQEPRSP
ncbi:MAG: hypothetical protein Q9219_005085 [cf. Caloplaca sp. 3 TL-2023]